MGFDETVMDKPTTNGPAPEDETLRLQLEARLQDASKAAELHFMEARRAERVVNACRAGLEQLDPPKQAADRDEVDPRDPRILY